MQDFHTHSNYSDGFFLPSMVGAAEEAGLDGIGFADHCVVSDREHMRDIRAAWGFSLDVTYERRREGIEWLRGEHDIDIYDAVEMDYHPADVELIASFLEEGDFDYVIGSVHEIERVNVQHAESFEGRPDDELDDVVDTYFDRLVSLVESELFDVAAHPDLIERTPPLRGRTTEEHYRKAAEAFANSRTIPEINAGRVLGDAEILHPDPDFLDVLLEYDVSVTIGSDAHEAEHVTDRTDFFEEFLEEHGIEPVAPPGIDA